MRAILLAMCLFMTPFKAAALCSGPDYIDTLAPEIRAEIDAVVARTPYAHGLVWTATKGGREMTIVGTIHIYDTRLDDLLARLTPRLTAADLLLVEAGPDEEEQMQKALTTRPELIFIVDGPTLPERLSEPAWQALADAARARQIPPFMAAKMQPWYLALTLAIPTCTMPDLAAGVRGLDHLLMGVAEGAGVPIKAVEPWDTLFTLMQGDSIEEQLEMLELGLLPPETQTALFVAMLNSYFAGNVVEIWEASRQSAFEVPGLDPARAAEMFAKTEQSILIDRNIAWIPRIDALSADHAHIMLAVGAAHLPGDTGILSLLAADGWTIRPAD